MTARIPLAALSRYEDAFRAWDGTGRPPRFPPRAREPAEPQHTQAAVNRMLAGFPDNRTDLDIPPLPQS